jgi:hypothetical protein
MTGGVGAAAVGAPNGVVYALDEARCGRAAMSIFDILAEQRIADAIRRGELDDLPGAGRPLDLTDEPFVSGEQRMVNRILANAGVAPPEIGLRKELAALRAELAALRDDAAGQRARLHRRIAVLVVELGEMRR